MPNGRTSPFEQTTTAVRRPMLAATSPTAAGRSRLGTAKTTRSTAWNSIFETGLAETRSGSSTPGRRSWLAPLPVMRSACSRVRQPSSTSRPARARRVASAVPIGPAPTTAAVRSAGMPPSHSYWSSTHGQILAVTSLARCAEGCSTRGKVSGRPQRTRTLHGRMMKPRRARSVPITATGTTGAPVSSARRPTPRFGSPREPRRMRVPSGKIITASPRSTSWRAVSIASSSDSPRRIGNAPSEFRNQPIQRFSNSSRLATK